MRFNIIYIISALLLVLSACNKTDIEQPEYGYMYACLEHDTGLEDVNPGTKAVIDAPEDMTFAIDIFDDNDEVVGHFDDHRELLANPIPLKTGTYRAVASCGTDGGAAFDAPVYSGSTEFTVRPETVEAVNIVCSLANVKVTANFDDAIKNNFSSYVLTVSNGLENGTLVYDMNAEGGSTLDREGYFAATGTLDWTLSLTNKEGETFELKDVCTDVKPRQHYKFSFSLQIKDETDLGGGYFTIVLDDSMNDPKEYDWSFVIETTQPVIDGSFPDGETAEFKEGNTSSKFISIATSGIGVSNVILSHSDDALEAAGLSKSIELVGISADARATLAGNGIIVPEIIFGTSSADLDFGAFIGRLPMADYSFDVKVITVEGALVERTVAFRVITAADIEAVSAEPWARFADITGTWTCESKPDGLTFMYRKASDADWSSYTGAVTFNDAEKTFAASLTGLLPETEYIFKAVSATETDTNPLTFTTDHEQWVPNMTFDGWYQDGKVWYPNVSSSDFYWDTANGGSKALSIYPTVPEDSHVIAGRAAKLKSEKVALVGLAAGNIYTGRFTKAIMDLSNPGAELEWGVPFTAKPLALKGHYDYAPATVNQGEYNGMSGKTDIGQIQIILTDWDAPFKVSTQTKTFVDVNADYVIGYGTMDLNQTSGYREFTINIDYRDSRRPSYIVIVASASKYGDYFTGGVGSTLYLDEFDFVYNPDEL